MYQLLFALASVVPVAPCAPRGVTIAELRQIKQADFAIQDDARRNSVALALLDCVGDPDPTIRDGLVYEGLAKWLRGKRLTPVTIRAMYDNLLGQLTAAPDAAGFRQPFAALILSEVARSDRIESVLSEAQRARLVTEAARYLRSVSDYRGFSETEGWRHGVAHGSDLVLQLAVNSQIDAASVDTLMAAIAVQVSPPGAVFYVYGEGDRLARAVFFAHRRGVLPVAWWDAWFEGVSSPAPLTGWNAAGRSQAGLAQHHNTLAFLYAIEFAAQSDEGEVSKPLAAAARKAITRLMGG